MMRLLVSVVLLCATGSGIVVGQGLPEPTLTYSQLPQYPPLAIIARIEGSGRLSLPSERVEVLDVPGENK
jgi:hypothetical protein